MDVFKNLAVAVVAQGYDDAATSIDLASGQGAKLPATACTLLWWNATDYPNPVDDPNAEYIRKDPHAADALTITRGQEGTAASAKNIAGKTYKVMQAITASQLALLLEAAATWSADNRLLRSDGTGRAVKDSPVALDDLGNLTGVENVAAQSANIGALRLTEGAAPATPPANTVAVYAKADGLVYAKDDAGNEIVLSGAGGGGGASGVVEIVSATGAPHTLAAANVGKLVQVDDAVTVPANATEAIAVGSVMLIQRIGAGAVTITPAGGVTVNPSGGPWAIASQYGIIGLHKTATDTWTIFGDYA